MRYKKFIFDTQVILDKKTDTMLFPFQPEYLEFQDWTINHPTEYNSLSKTNSDSLAWQGLIEEVHPIRGDMYSRKLYYKDYTLWVESDVRKLPNQDYQTHGEQVTYYRSGNIQYSENYRNGNREGEFIQYIDSKNKVVNGKGYYTKDKKSGDWFYYFPHTTDVQISEVYDKVLRKRIEFNKAGDVIKEFNYDKTGELDKLFRDAHGNGELRTRGFMKNGLMNGKWFFYYIDGSPEYEVVFENGVPVGKLTYLSMDGKVMWESEV